MRSSSALSVCVRACVHVVWHAAELLAGAACGVAQLLTINIHLLLNLFAYLRAVWHAAELLAGAACGVAQLLTIYIRFLLCLFACVRAVWHAAELLAGAACSAGALSRGAAAALAFCAVPKVSLFLLEVFVVLSLVEQLQHLRFALCPK